MRLLNFFSSDRFFLVAQAVLKHHSSLSILRAVTHLALNIVSVFPDLVFQFSLCSLTLIPIADLIVLPSKTYDFLIDNSQEFLFFFSHYQFIGAF